MQNTIKKCIMLLLVISFQYKAQDKIFTEDIIENIKSRVDNGLIAGIAIGVITPEGTSYFNYGVKSLETKEHVDENTVFEIGSITKTFTGVLLANEVVNGKLSLDTPLQDLLPEGIKAPTRNGDYIKLVNLANHTASFPRMPDNNNPVNPADPFKGYTIEQAYEFLNTYELPYDIGTKLTYSNYGTGMLGNVLAAKNNTTYEELIVKNIAMPLGMRDTRIALSTDMKERLAKGYSIRMEVEGRDLTSIAGAGAIRSTVADMLKYLGANMGIEQTELYPALQLSHKYSGASDRGANFGLGWITMDIEGVDVVWHDGATRGYMSFAGFTKDGEKGVVILTNSRSMPDDIGFHLLNPKSKLQNPKASIAIKLNEIFQEDGIEAAVKSYMNLKSNQEDEYNFAETELNMLGYRYIALGKKKEAVAILKINMEQFPDSWNANDSYADALREVGQNEKAIKYYKRSLELNPDNSNGINMLKKLGEAID